MTQPLGTAVCAASNNNDDDDDDDDNLKNYIKKYNDDNK